LQTLNCSTNLLKALDVSKNTSLTAVDCSNNNLESLNVKNGNNSILTSVNFETNPNLKTILVDKKTDADTNWSSAKDTDAIYSDGSALGITDVVFGKMSIYPNPSKGEIHIDNVTLQKANVYDASGKLIQSVNFKNGSDNNTLHLNGVAKGIYYLFIESEGANTAKKIVIE
jgi:hypothetical protein